MKPIIKLELDILDVLCVHSTKIDRGTIFDYLHTRYDQNDMSMISSAINCLASEGLIQVAGWKTSNYKYGISKQGDDFLDEYNSKSEVHA